jgi:hypothetical protein
MKIVFTMSGTGKLGLHYSSQQNQPLFHTSAAFFNRNIALLEKAGAVRRKFQIKRASASSDFLQRGIKLKYTLNH